MNTSGGRARELITLIVACAIGVALRPWLASRGHNFDMESWTITADIVTAGDNVYANTYRHPYGPVWFLILGALKCTHDALGLARFGPESFHLVIAAFLSLADIAIGWLLYRGFGLIAALFFVLNPVSIWISGYHSQIDNLAILPAVGAWLILRRENASWGRITISAALLGLSLATKHILLFFPIWLLMCSALVRSGAKRMALGFVPYAVLAAIVVPFIVEPRAWIGFREYVIGYKGLASNHTLWLHVLDVFAPPNAVDSLFGIVPEGVSILHRLFIVLMLVVGWIVAHRRPGEMFFLYLLAMVAFTNTMADQYLAIPLVACAAYWRHVSSWIYLIPATLLLYWPAADAGSFPALAPRWHAYASHLSYPHAQIWMAILFAVVLIRGARRGGASRGKDQVRPDL